MIPRTRVLALALIVLAAGPTRAQGGGTPACQTGTIQARDHKTRNEQLVRDYVAAMTSVRDAKAAGDMATAIQSLRQSRRIAGEFGPLMKAMRANAVDAHRHGCIGDALLAMSIEVTTVIAQTYRKLGDLAAQHERELRSQTSRR
ncbi:hypothetical protein [Salinarimonas soli]|uniref:Periplasmic heavy metal sensor n=1 Tax=Salinarimonas soli TaxID=1638099 RepID=A0A5B2V9E9_9HYPH|nr:hypothetical protein [Salinarimonas soli]KAA2235012.1 hypothetical protein F0L46_22000 [Salinarimonas soli]